MTIHKFTEAEKREKTAFKCRLKGNQTQIIIFKSTPEAITLMIVLTAMTATKHYTVPKRSDDDRPY